MNKYIFPEELKKYGPVETLNGQAVALLEQQKNVWDTAGSNYGALATVRSKSLSVGYYSFQVQFNPSRIVSSAAKVDTHSIRERKCFLCTQNLPEVQQGLPFGDRYMILVNPFPIFPQHLTVPLLEHSNQRILEHFPDMLELGRQLERFVIFYNGPKCGASAPDHMHFQAGNKGFLPMQKDWELLKRDYASLLLRREGVSLFRLTGYPQAAFVVESSDREKLVRCFRRIYDLLPVGEGEEEPMLNILCSFENGHWIVWIFPRRLHRPSQYFDEGPERLLISPASVDLGGIFITPREEDFNRLSPTDIEDILHQISITPASMEELCNYLKENE